MRIGDSLRQILSRNCGRETIHQSGLLAEDSSKNYLVSERGLTTMLFIFALLALCAMCGYIHSASSRGTDE